MASDEVIAPWTVDELLDGDPLTHGHGPLEMVWMQLHAYLHDRDEHVVRAFCETVRRRPGVIGARLVVLHLADEASGPLAELLDELLVSDRLLYAHSRGTELVASALRVRWSALDDSQRSAVLSNIKFCELASPSFARTRTLIAAIPESERGHELQELLASLGGPPPPTPVIRELDVNEIAARKGIEDPPPRSIAERIAEIPTLVAAAPIPWSRVASALYEDERAQHEARDTKLPRLLSGETAALCVEAALAEIENFPKSALPDHDREEVLRSADICLAHPYIAEDDKANARWIAALRKGVFESPVRTEVAVHALSFTRPWHWRQQSARDLVLDVLGSATDPAVVRAAIHPLYRAGAEAIIAGARALINATRIHVDEETADSLGRLMGGAALHLPDVPEELHRWLDAMPTTGVLETAAARKEFLSGVAFAMKESAHHDPIDPQVYAEWATKVWSVWRTPELTKIEGKGSIALHLMSPLQQFDRGESVAAKYWSALRPLFQQVLKSCDSNEVYSALFDLDVDNLLPIALEDLASTLQEAARTKDSDDNGLNSEGRIAQALCEIAVHNLCNREVASAIHQTLVAVGARKEAIEVERRWRDRSGLLPA